MDNQAVLNYMMSTAPFLFFTLDRTGHILKMNQYAVEHLGQQTPSLFFEDFLANFNHQFDVAEVLNSSGPVLLSISLLTGLPQSYNFYFQESDDAERILVFGHSDAEDLALMQGEIFSLNQQLSNLTRALHKKNAKLKQTLDHVKKLQGIVPICMHCHKIRSDKEIWERLETYLSEHTEAELSHGICPDCMDKHYPEYKRDL